MYLHLRPVIGDVAFKTESSPARRVCTPVRPGQLTDAPQGGQRVGTAAGDMEFFFGPKRDQDRNGAIPAGAVR